VGVKCWIYKGEILEGAKGRVGLRNEPEPRRPQRDRRPERRDRDGRPERQDRPPAPPPVHSDQPGGPAMQQLPVEGARQTTGPIMPPLVAPQPSWKQEMKQEPKQEAPKQETPKQEEPPKPATEQTENK